MIVILGTKSSVRLWQLALRDSIWQVTLSSFVSKAIHRLLHCTKKPKVCNKSTTSWQKVYNASKYWSLNFMAVLNTRRQPHAI